MLFGVLLREESLNNHCSRKINVVGPLFNTHKFAQDFLEDKLKPFYKSEPIPESNDEDVKIVVGKNLDQIVLDESKDVLLEPNILFYPAGKKSFEPVK